MTIAWRSPRCASNSAASSADFFNGTTPALVLTSESDLRSLDILFFLHFSATISQRLTQIVAPCAISHNRSRKSKRNLHLLAKKREQAGIFCRAPVFVHDDLCI